VKKFNPKNENIQLADVLDRIRAAKSLKEQKDAGELLGIKPSNLSKKKASNSIPVDKIQLFCIQENLNEEWVFTGIGAMRPDDHAAEAGCYKRLSDRESELIDRWRLLSAEEKNSIETILKMKGRG